MGFFKKLNLKKITGGIKKFVKKNVNLKSLVKVGAMVDPSGIVAGLAQNHQAKKEQAQAELEALQQEQAFNDLSNTEKVNLVEQRVLENNLRINPTFADIIKGAGAGALTGAGQVLGGSKTAGDVGASVMDSTLKTWFKTNWWKVVVFPLGIALIIWGVIKMLGKKRTGGRYRR